MGEVMAGKTIALAMLVERYHVPLFGYLYRLVHGDRPLAEDLIKAGFIGMGKTYGRMALSCGKCWATCHRSLASIRSSLVGNSYSTWPL